MNKFRHIHIISPPHGSIAEITRDLIENLKNDFIISIDSENEVPYKHDILLSHFLNPAISKTKSFNLFNKRILIQPIDGTSLKKDMVKEINKYDLIITPANAGRNIMIENKVKSPIIVIPNYYKEDIFSHNIKEIKEIPKDRIVLYHESTFHSRKGIEELYETYINAFSDNKYTDKVVLVLKDMPFNQVTFDRIEKLKRETIELQSQYKNPAKIIKISQYCNEEQLRQLWHRANIYVSLARIEGFGIPLLRMAALKKRIIALDSPLSGYGDFLNNKNSYLIPTKEVLAQDELMFLYDEKKTKWSIPKSLEESVDIFQLCVEEEMDKRKNLYPRTDNLKVKNMEINIVMEKYKQLLKNI